ncbi:MAG: hypothetical protein R2710_11030 [Acidimicrobiales bacterium]
MSASIGTSLVEPGKFLAATRPHGAIGEADFGDRPTRAPRWTQAEPVGLRRLHTCGVLVAGAGGSTTGAISVGVDRSIDVDLGASIVASLRA